MTYLLLYLNSNIEIHKYKYGENTKFIEINLNSNIEIHKFEDKEALDANLMLFKF